MVIFQFANCYFTTQYYVLTMAHMFINPIIYVQITVSTVMGTINRTYIHNTITKYSYWSCVHLAVNQGPPHDSCWVRSGTTFCRGCLWVQRIPGRLCWSLAPCPSLSRKKLTAGAGFEAWTPENQHEDEGFMFFFHVSVYVHVNTHTYYTYIYI